MSFSAGSIATASDRPALFKVEKTDEKGERSYFKKSRRIEMNAHALSEPTLTIDLFGAPVTAIRDTIERRADGAVSWIGHISGSPGERVVLTGRRNAFAGHMTYNGVLYEISRGRGGDLIIGEIDPGAMPQEEPLHLPHAPNYGFTTGRASKAQAPATAGAPVQQDILVAYTDDACRDEGGNGSDSCDQVEAKIVNAVASMNAAYTASDVNITMNLVGMVQINYDEGGKSASEMLGELRSTSDGEIDRLHDDRNDYGADLLALITGSGGGYCGIAYVNASASYAMSVTATGCLSNGTLAHEIGHNQGSSHARSQNSGGVSGNYNYGYRRCNDGSVDDVGAPFFSTIMAYGCSGAARINNFSNPNVNHNGAPTGIDPADDADNAAWAARTLSESASRIAGFRDSTTPPDPTDPPPPPPTPDPPSAPSNLVAAADGTSEIVLTWSDNANNEDQFRLQRAIGGGSFSTIANLSANTTGHRDDGLDPGTTYRYRVRASNSDGVSSWSSTAQATTNANPTTTDDRALGDVAQANGRLEGDFRDTHADDGDVQRLVETSGGALSANHQYRGDHVWRFDILGGGDMTFEVNAYVSGREGFRFDYRRAGERAWNPMFVVDSNNRANIERFTFPSGLTGVIYVRARDAFLAKNEAEDTLSVDFMTATTNPSTDERAQRETTPLVFNPNTALTPQRRVFAPVYFPRRDIGYVPTEMELSPIAPTQSIIYLPATTARARPWRDRYTNFRTRLRD